MPDPLFPALLLLALLDLGFVNATGAVSAANLAPLWTLAALAPWLRRLQRYRSYHVAWNLGVLIGFALLVHHATTTGLLHMLEDGLILAAVCQVHLLNNVGEKQRPDLIFFNSFLIAFVTSFFAPDLWWSLLFVLHAFVLVPGLELHSMLQRGRALATGTIAALVRDSVPRTVAITAATGLLFVAWPRDFERRGWLGDALALGQGQEAGIADRIRLGDEGPVRLGNEVVVRLEPTSGAPEDVPSHWRALAFTEFDGSTWSPQHALPAGARLATDVAWERRPDGTWQRSGPLDERRAVRVRLFDRAAARLPAPLAAVRVQPEAPPGLEIEPRVDGSLGLARATGSSAEPLVYTVGIAPITPGAALSAWTRSHLTALPDAGVPRLVTDLGAKLRRQSPPDADALAIAQSTATWLEGNRRYQRPGEPGFARNLGEFLVGTGAGHCEYFATALALLLRVQRVPCRVVGGYLAHERDDSGQAILVRSRDAHAWVEVLAADGTWHTFDATPAASVQRGGAVAESWWEAVVADLERLWAKVTTFDRQRRSESLWWVLALPRSQPVLCGLLAAALAAWLLRRRRREPPEVTRLRRAMARARLHLQPGETPREMLSRAAAGPVRPARLAALAAAAGNHEQSRYGGGTTTNRCPTPTR